MARLAIDRVKVLYLAQSSGAGAVDYLPHVYVEVRIDFNDVRTGFRETVGLSKALEIYSGEADLLWAADMIRDVDPGRVGPELPACARLRPLPEFVDANFLSRMESQFTQYLLRCFERSIYRNFALNLYSFPGESLGDFTRRCMELFDSPMRQELDNLNEVFKRKLERIKQKYLTDNEPSELELARLESQNRSVFSLHADHIAGLFLRSELANRPVFEPLQAGSGVQEFEQRLASLEIEAEEAISKIWEAYDEKARGIDEYVLHPNLKDIHFVRSCILWMPANPAVC